MNAEQIKTILNRLGYGVNTLNRSNGFNTITLFYGRDQEKIRELSDKVTDEVLLSVLLRGEITKHPKETIDYTINSLKLRNQYEAWR